MKARTMWEYKYIYMKTRTDDMSIEMMLNELGGDGWELVSVFGGTDNTSSNATIHSYVFKRPRI